MKRLLFIATAIMSLVSACQRPELPGADVVELADGPVVLQDQQFGMYYGDTKGDTVGVFTIVLSDALCYQDKLGSPYMDSEGDMLVLQVRTPLLSAEEKIAIPFGSYEVSQSGREFTIHTPESYVVRTVGTVQSKWAFKSGSIDFAEGKDGKYSLTTKDLAIEKDGVVDTVSYVGLTDLFIDDYMLAAPSLITTTDDIINIPFPYLSCTYHGDLWGGGTGNFIVNIATKGFIEADEEGNEYMNDVPGIYITMNFMSRLFSGNSVPFLEKGRYDVAASNGELLARWTLLPGMYMQGTSGTSPIGTYILQQPAEGEGAMEFISGGYVEVDFEGETANAGTEYTLTYSFTTSKRSVYGVWTGVMPARNLATTSNESYLTTLDHDVDCDMSKVTSGTLRLIETLHRDNIEEAWDYDIAEAWQLYLEPRDWTAEEKAIDWVDPENPLGPDGIEGTEDDYMNDKNNNGIRDRLEAWCGDGDVMVLEFILPLGSQGVIAPVLNQTYIYTMQPSLTLDAEMYEIYVSQMGRPADEVFDQQYAKQYPGWAEQLGLDPNNDADYDRCNARRGFTWSSDGFRGNWYLHYETGRHRVLDGHAPAINGTVKVTRTADNVYDFEWDFIDDNPGTPNRITGSMKDCVVKIQLN